MPELNDIYDLIDEVVSIYSESPNNGMYTAREFAVLLKAALLLKYGDNDE